MRTGVARREHVAELVRIVNAAYAEGEAGLWVDGTSRTDGREIAAAVRAGEMLVATTVGGRVVGCVRVRAVDDGPCSWEIGFVSVDPAEWGSGVGRALVLAAEDHARAHGATTVRLTLLVPRAAVHPAKERLRDWYTRLGYSIAGSVPFEDALPDAAPHLTAPCDLLLFTKPT